MDACRSSLPVDSRQSPAATPRPQKTRPFLKWAGNKFRILEQVKSLLPDGQRLVEPFAGSGAVFLNSAYDRYLLTDSNPDLINLYCLLKQEGPGFIRECQEYFTPHNNQELQYYKLRDQFNQASDMHLRSILFVYLNRHGYNGLCRYNASGGFNVPFGRYKQPYFPAKEMLAFHQQARRAEFQVRDFNDTFQQARPGDVIYCDPPYVPLSASSNFTSYSAGGFSLAAQSRLAELAMQAARQGIPVLISNHNTRFTRDAYKAAQTIKRFKVQRYISCNGQQRNSAGEILALFK